LTTPKRGREKEEEEEEGEGKVLYSQWAKTSTGLSHFHLENCHGLPSAKTATTLSLFPPKENKRYGTP